MKWTKQGRKKEGMSELLFRSRELGARLNRSTTASVSPWAQ